MENKIQLEKLTVKYFAPNTVSLSFVAQVNKLFLMDI